MAEITDFGPRKTILILAVVVGCFAVLWPKVFYPMLTASVTSHHSTNEKSACCDVIFENDVTIVDIMQEMCKNILRYHQINPRIRDALTPEKSTPQSSSLCREEVLARCGIDLSSFLAEKERLGHSYKQVLEEIRRFNSSLCLKTNFGIPLSQLGIPHLIRYHILMPHNSIRQERRTPPHAGSFHPALRERGRAIPSSHIIPRVVDRSDHVGIPKMRPPLGGAGHITASKGNGTMGIVMPLYTIGIILFFMYTIAKVLKKNTDSEVISEYPNVDAEKEFRNMVFNPDLLASAMTGSQYHYSRENSSSSLRPTPTIEELKDQAAGDIEIDQLRQRLVETEAAMERIVVQMGNISRSVMHDSSSRTDFKEDDKGDSEVLHKEEMHNRESEDPSQAPTVKVMGVELTASCEGGQKVPSRPTTPIIPASPSHIEREKTPPKPIYLEGTLPPQCELLVTDSEIKEQKTEENGESPIVLSGKMTLSLISLDQIATESDRKMDKSNEENEGESSQEEFKNDRSKEINNKDVKKKDGKCYRIVKNKQTLLVEVDEGQVKSMVEGADEEEDDELEENEKQEEEVEEEKCRVDTNSSQTNKYETTNQNNHGVQRV